MLKQYLPLVIVVVLVLWLGFSVIPGVLGVTPTPVAAVTVISAPTSTGVPTANSTPVPPVNTSSPTSEPAPTNTPMPTSTLTPTDTPAPPPTNTDTPVPTSTPPPPPPPVPTAEAVVLANELNLRAGPGTVYASIGVLRQGDALDIQGRASGNEWIQVVPARLDTSGWVAVGAGLVQVNTDLDPLPILTPLPPPPTATPSISALAPPGFTYPAPQLTNPDDGVGTQGTFPPLYWQWDGQLADDEYFEVRVWYEELPYHPGLGWVKQPQFDYNVSGERNGKYFWTVVIVKDIPENVRTKDWYKPDQWPYPVYEHNPDTPIDSIQVLSPEREPRFFYFTPDPGRSSGGGGSSISKPCHDPDDC